MALNYATVVAALQAFEGDEQSSECQQYIASIADETVTLPSGAAVPAYQALLHYNKLANLKTIRDAAEETPPRKLTMAGVQAAPATVTPATTASAILAALQAFPDEQSQACAAYKSALGGQTVTMYDLYENAVTVRAADMLRYYNKGFSDDWQ